MNGTHSQDWQICWACWLVGFWADKPGWCWFVVREKHCWLVDKSWLKLTSKHAGYLKKKKKEEKNLH